jgi:hypothetical protein
MTAGKYATNTRRGRPFAKNNPGKPHGCRHRVTVAVENLMDGEAERLSRKCIDMALAGDTTALRLCLERIAPARRSRPVRIALPGVESPQGVTNALAVVVVAMADGVLSPDEAAAVTSVIEVQRRALETLSLDARLRQIEEQLTSDAQH